MGLGVKLEIQEEVMDEKWVRSQGEGVGMEEEARDFRKFELCSM